MNSDQFIPVTQGNCKTSTDPNDIFTCVLGSCIAVCLFDQNYGIGGMNHFLLPTQKNTNAPRHNRFGAHSMEVLINQLLGSGAAKDQLCAKVFGGSQVTKGFSTIGAQNSAFIEDYLSQEGISCVSKSLGGSQARQVRFWPVTGNVKMLLLPDTKIEVENTEVSYSDDTTLF